MPTDKATTAPEPVKADSGAAGGESARSDAGQPRPRKVRIEPRDDDYVLTTNHAVGEGTVDVFDAGPNWDEAVAAAKRYATHFSKVHGHPYEASED